MKFQMGQSSCKSGHKQICLPLWDNEIIMVSIGHHYHFIVYHMGICNSLRRGYQQANESLWCCHILRIGKALSFYQIYPIDGNSNKE